jgi:hypothetical protein
MNKATIASGAFATVIACLAWDLGHNALEQQQQRRAVIGSARTAPATPAGTGEGLIYGRVTTDDGSIYEGRLRWGGDEEALWGNYFNGFKAENPWLADVPAGQLSKGQDSFEVFGIEIARWERKRSLGRPFMAQFFQSFSMIYNILPMFTRKHRKLLRNLVIRFSQLQVFRIFCLLRNIFLTNP